MNKLLFLVLSKSCAVVVCLTLLWGVATVVSPSTHAATNSSLHLRIIVKPQLLPPGGGGCPKGAYNYQEIFYWYGGLIHAENDVTAYYDGHCDPPILSNHNCYRNDFITGPSASISVTNCSQYPGGNNAVYAEQDLQISGGIKGVNVSGTAWDYIYFSSDGFVSTVQSSSY
jgi:hypothetical protein